ncbi:MAG: hypothetical protein IJJ99_06800 [Oscillospiraceae bacterium]|nr:hypothetical protein [Oscillospiraceae bacterium]
MRTNICRSVSLLLVILLLLLCGCQGTKQETAVTETFSAEDESPAAEKERIRAFWKAHEDELEEIAVDLLAFERENASDDLPYTIYQPQTGLTASDGLETSKPASAPELEEKLHDLCALPDCPFELIGASVDHYWLDADFCQFYKALLTCRLSLLYFAEEGFELPEDTDHEKLSEHWAILLDWSE